jgi:hypothetical protein
MVMDTNARTARTAAGTVPLRPYQVEAARAIVTSVCERRGDSISVEIARQGGKNELSAQVELLLLMLSAARDVDAIKCAPTFRPQLAISMRRLWQCIAQASMTRVAKKEPNAIRIGRARLLFLSAEAGANVVGHTASLMMEVDEAQDVAAEKFDRDFRPMAATSNATTVYYGTAWDDTTLLERAKQANLEAERRDGVRRHFEYDWQTVARYNPAYAAYVEGERNRLGETHPLFLTQYCLKPISGGGRLLSPSQLAQLDGHHARQSVPAAGEAYVAGLDLAGGDDATDTGDASAAGGPHTLTRSQAHKLPRDATVLTIGRLVYPDAASLVREPRVEIIEHCAWIGEPHELLLPRLIDLLRDVWRVQRVAVDATGLGETAARLLASALGSTRVDAVKFTAESKSQLGFGLLAAINGGRLKCYRGDGSAEHRTFRHECERAKVAYRANRTMNFFVDASDGHDDYLMSAALLVRASLGQQRRIARQRVSA